MPKTLNFTNLVPDELEADLGTHPWGDLLYEDSCLISSYAAQACLKELATPWNDDLGQDREFVLSTLDLTLTLLTTWRKAFAAVVLNEDKLDAATEELASLMAEGRLSVEALANVSKSLDDVAKARAKASFDESEVRALAKAAFAPKKEAQ
jgi:uncharacterized protein YoaH (UPF0181 family)